MKFGTFFLVLPIYLASPFDLLEHMSETFFSGFWNEDETLLESVCMSVRMCNSTNEYVQCYLKFTKIFDNETTISQFIPNYCKEKSSLVQFSINTIWFSKLSKTCTNEDISVCEATKNCEIALPYFCQQ